MQELNHKMKGNSKTKSSYVNAASEGSLCIPGCNEAVRLDNGVPIPTLSSHLQRWY